MLLSNKSIFEALDDRRLVIDPEPQPRYGNVENSKTPFDSTAVNLTLGNVISVPKQGLSINLDLTQGNVVNTLKTIYEEREISAESPYTLQPNDFILAQTKEKVILSKDRIIEWGDKPLLAARVEGKSSFARCGLLVHFTAPTIHCGFSGKITLEIICLGKYPIVLKPGMSICQLLIESVSGDPVDYVSQFHNQERPAGNN